MDVFKRKNDGSVKKTEQKRRRTQLVQDGLAIVSVGALLVLNAVARGINLLMALGAFFVGFLAIDYFWGKRILRNLKVTRKLPDSICVGEPFYVEIELDATKRKSSAWAVVAEDQWSQEESVYDAPRILKKNVEIESEETIDVNDKFANKKKASRNKKNKKVKRLTAKQASVTDAALHDGVETLKPVVYFPNIHKREKIKEYYVGVFTRRGTRRLKSLTLSTRFPCGFFRSSERFDAPDEIVVFPRVGKLTSAWTTFLSDKAAQETKAATSMTSRIPDETAAIRDWRSGDSKRTIAWRATAKRNRLQSRDFTKRQTRTTILILDLFLSPASKKASKEDLAQRWLNVEKAVSFAATLVKKYTDTSDSQLYFALNADIPDLFADNKERNKNVLRNISPNDWDLVVGGGSTRLAFTRLALALPPQADRLQEIALAAQSYDLKDKQVFIVSVDPIKLERLDLESRKNALLIDASNPMVDQFFQYD